MKDKLFKIMKHKRQEMHTSLIVHIITNHSEANKCWEWRGSCDRKGYAQIRISNKLYYVSRIIAFITHELDINRKDLFACHSCDNPRCINPAHIFVGTCKANLADMIKKGRQKKRRVKPNETDLIVLKAREEGKSLGEAAELAGISVSYAGNIDGYLKRYWVSTGHYCQKT